MHTTKVVLKTSNRKILIMNLKFLSAALRFIMIGNPSADYTNKKNGVLKTSLLSWIFFFAFFRQVKAIVKCIWNARHAVEEGTEVIFSAPSPIACVILSIPASCYPEQMQKKCHFCRLKAAYQPIIIKSTARK